MSHQVVAEKGYLMSKGYKNVTPVFEETPPTLNS